MVVTPGELDVELLRLEVQRPTGRTPTTAGRVVRLPKGRADETAEEAAVLWSGEDVDGCSSSVDLTAPRRPPAKFPCSGGVP